MRIIGSGILLALAIGSAWFLSYPFETVLVVGLIGMSKVIGNLAGVAQGILNGFELMEFSRGAKIAERVVTTAVSIGLVWAGFGILYVGGAFVLGAIAQLLVAVGSYSYVSRARGISAIQFEVNFNLWYDIIIEAWPFIASSIFVFIYFDIDTIMISILIGQTEVGWYSGAYRLLTVFGFIPGAFMSAVYPVMSRFYDSSNDSLGIFFDKSLKYLLVIVLPLAVGTFIVADKAVLLIYGKEYVQSILVLQVLIWTQIAIFQNQVFSTMIASIDKQIVQPITTGLLALSNIILNFILIPIFGIIGAAVATVSTEFLGVILSLYWLHQFYRLPKYQDIFRIFATTSMMASILYVLDKFEASFVVLVLSGISVYCIGVYVFGVIDETDIEIFTSILPKIS